MLTALTSHAGCKACEHAPVANLIKLVALIISYFKARLLPTCSLSRGGYVETSLVTKDSELISN